MPGNSASYTYLTYLLLHSEGNSYFGQMNGIAQNLQASEDVTSPSWKHCQKPPQTNFVAATHKYLQKIMQAMLRDIILV